MYIITGACAWTEKTNALTCMIMQSASHITNTAKNLTLQLDLDGASTITQSTNAARILGLGYYPAAAHERSSRAG